MKKLLNQRGVGALEMILVVLLLIAIGAAGYFAYQARQADSDAVSSKNVTTEKTEAKKVDPYAGWKTFESIAYKGARFQYPDNWTIKVEDSPFPEFPNSKNVTLTSPKGFMLSYIEYIAGLGGGCENPDLHVILNTVEELKSASNASLYYIENESIIAIASDGAWRSKKANTWNTGTCLFYPLVSTGGGDANKISFASSIQVRGDDKSLLVADKAELAEARLILKSFKF